MLKKETVEIKVNIELLRNTLLKKLHCNESCLLADIIILNLEKSPKGLEQLFMAFTDIAPVAKFKINDEISIDIGSVTSWNKDRKKMELNKDMVFQGRLKATISYIDLQENASYTIEFIGYDDMGIERAFTENVYEDRIQLRLEDFMED